MSLGAYHPLFFSPFTGGREWRYRSVKGLAKDRGNRHQTESLLELRATDFCAKM
jgi:hypothetical protein